jgi:hypothetical protein
MFEIDYYAYRPKNTHTNKFQFQPSTGPPLGRNVAKITNRTSTALSSPHGFTHTYTPAPHSDEIRTAPSILRTPDVSVLTLTTIARWSLHYWHSSLRQIVFLRSARNWFSSTLLLRRENTVRANVTSYKWRTGKLSSLAAHNYKSMR